MTANTNARYDVIHIGPYFCDLIFSGLPDVPQIGCEVYGTELHMLPGGAFNTTYALHRLGLKTGWVTDFGSDYFSKFVLDRVNELGIDTTFFKFHDHNVAALSVAFSYDYDRGFISYMDTYKTSDLAAILQEHRPRILLIGGLECGCEFVEFSKTARELDIVLVMDCQYRDVTMKSPGVIEAIQAVDLFMPNCCETVRLTGAKDALEGARILAQYNPFVVIKMGRRGAFAIHEGVETLIPAMHIENVVDTTGAGDSFNAGFLYGYLNGSSVETCLKYGNLMGGLCVTGYGVTQIPNKDQLELLVHQYDNLVAGEGDLPHQPSLGLNFSCTKGH